MIYVFYFFAAVLVFTSYKSLRGGIDYLAFFKRELAEPQLNYTPFASVIAPCRGADEGLEENLTALFRQNYPFYEIIFAVDDANDEAVKIIKKVSGKYAKTSGQNKKAGQEDEFQITKPKFPYSKANAVSAKLVIAGKATNESQKVHNLREAVNEISDESEVLVFVDSDARPSKNWLRDLTAPLQNEKIGCATGYRWFFSDRNNFSSVLLSVWNASIASALGANMRSNFCWGGSTAIRRDVFAKLEIRKHWRGTLSDDFAVTRRMKKAGLPVYFVPQALTASFETLTFSELLEFTTRQMKITRVYAPDLWIASLIGSFLFNLVLIWGIFILIFNSISDFAFWYAFTALIAICVFSTGKAFFRLKAVKLILADYEDHINKQFWSQNTLWILTPALFLFNCLAALFSRQIAWRGIKYQLNSPEQTSIITENNDFSE